MCEVEEQQAVRVDMQLPKRRAVICVEPEETQDYAWEWRRYGDLSQEEGEASALCQVR